MTPALLTSTLLPSLVNPAWYTKQDRDAKLDNLYEREEAVAARRSELRNWRPSKKALGGHRQVMDLGHRQLAPIRPRSVLDHSMDYEAESEGDMMSDSGSESTASSVFDPRL
ncbi:hypothetical protein HK097_007121 [Rhizophlyctis rosea]|uniref:Uncharacterized protein n=1 Tax=Rhizophlyctis rosea TaxID=64517 RepID=A0AAD5SIV1_9FUNG|nr:hypothetical protein HK097_007121 [Rhizophlyctis rosea]